MNSSAKGARLEREFEKWLIEHGWTCYRPPRAKWGRGVEKGGTDILGFGDILAARMGLTPMLVQVTTAPNVAAHRTGAQALDAQLLASGFLPVLAAWHGGQPSSHPRAVRGWRVEFFRPDPDGPRWGEPMTLEDAPWPCDLAG